MKITGHARQSMDVRATIAAILGSVFLGGYALQALAAEEQLEEVRVTGTRIQQRGDYASPTPLTTISAGDLEKLGIVNVSDAMVQIPQNVSQFTPANTGGGAFFVGSTLANLRGLNPFFGTRTLTLVDSRRFIPTTQGDSVDLNFIPSNLIQRVDVVTGGASAAYGSGAISGVVNVLLDKKLNGIKLDADYGATTHGDGQNYHVGLAGGTDFAGGRGHIVAGGEIQNQDAIQSCADARDWCHQAMGFFNNNTGFAFTPGQPYTPKVAGLPNYVIVSGLRENQLSKSGVIFNGATGATSTLQFNAAGTDVVPFAIGQQGWIAPGGEVVGGDGALAGTNLTLMPEVKRQTFFTHANFDFTDRITGYAEASYGDVKGINHQWAPAQNRTDICVRSDNAYLGTLSAAAQAALTNARTGFFNSNSPFTNFFNGGCLGGTIVSKDWQGQNNQTVTTDTKVVRGVLGANGKLWETWTWDAYYQYGKTTRDQIGQGYHTNWRFTMAVDSILDPRVGSPTFGKPVCRATVTGLVPSSTPFGYVPVADPSLIAGCQPLNPFGSNTASAAALAYAYASLTEHDDIRQDVFAASTTGELWKGWGAGPLSGAFGIEYRKDKLDNNAGNLPLAIRTDFDLQYGDSFSGSTSVTEGYAEFEMPMLKDLPAVKQLTLNAAVREAQYKTDSGPGAISGSATNDITTYKFSTVWEMNDYVRFRGSYSRDIRAPGFRELFYSQSIPPGGIFGSTTNPWIALSPPAITNQTDAAYLILNGNPAVKPEKASTLTMGFVLSPGGWAERMHFSADYYRINLTGGLALGNAQNNVNQCFAAVGASGNPITSTNPYCKYLTFGTPIPGNSPYSNITATRAIYLNQNPYMTKGIDFAWDYSLPLGEVFKTVPGSLLFRLTASKTLETKIPTGIDVAGQTGGDQGFLSDFAASPKWSGNMTVTYSTGPFAATIQGRYVSAGTLDLQNPKTGPDQTGYNPGLTYSVSDNNVPSYLVYSLNGSYDLKWFNTEKLEVFASINNLFDKDPPFSAGNVGGVNATFFDALGRTYKVGFRMKL